jgi:acetoin utilization deacetylase AcuC-like enzyme
VQHYTFGGEGINPASADRWLIEFEKEVNEFNDVEIIFYQAGADPHIDDPLGGTLTSEQMRRRDQILFSTAKKLGIPVVWNLAGGYQTPIENVLELHKTTYLIAKEYSR